MRLRETAFGVNVSTNRGGQSDWGQELGQSADHWMDLEGFQDILNGMIYYKVDDAENIECKLGKGCRENKPLLDRAKETNFSLVVASVFKKIYVNNIELPNQSLIMFILKNENEIDSTGKVNVHYQRRQLKFPDKATYQGQSLNENCILAIADALGCKESGSWIITDMNMHRGDLMLTAIVVDKEKPYDFPSAKHRSEFIANQLQLLQNVNIEPSTYEKDLTPVILYGPAGTGKTFEMQREYISKFDSRCVFATTFHQSFSYEEYIEGLKPILSENEDIQYKIEDGIFKQACELAAQIAGYSNLLECIKDSAEARKSKMLSAIEKRMLVLLCIDELNRGNVASIFGDTISLIEESKRLGADNEMTVLLPYSKERFGVPANLVIVGTMNTADRSIQLLDTAIRRRFKFVEKLPESKGFKNEKAAEILTILNARIRGLMNKDVQIGQSYLMHCTSCKEIVSVMLNKIIPLLEEYFYNDIDKIRFVLNEVKNKDPYYFYVEDEKAKSSFESYVRMTDMSDESKSFYILNKEIEKVDKEDECEQYLNHLIA